MPTEQVEPIIWRISPDDTAKALRILQDADKARVDRLRLLNGARIDRWPGYEIRVHVENGSRLLADRDHGKTIEELILKVQRDGLRAGIRLEIQW